MIEPIVLESNQNHATITNTGICPTLSAGMGMGGGWIPMVVIEVDNEEQLVRRQWANTGSETSGNVRRS